MHQHGKEEPVTELEVDQTHDSVASPTAEPATLVTPALIIINVVVFGLMAAKGVPILQPTGESVLPWGANYGPMTLAGQWWRPLTSLFLHFGIVHLLLNMAVLANIGLFVEAFSGSAGFLALYLVAGIGGGAASLAWHPFVVSAGASGAIFGLYGALLAFLLLHRGTVPRETLSALLKGAAVFVGYNLIYGLAQPEVDLAAHVGGLLTGFLGGLVVVQPIGQPSASGTSWRALVLSGAGVVLLMTTPALLPAANDLRDDLKRFSEIESTTLSLYNSSMEKWKADTMSDEQFGQIVEHQVLPRWLAERQRLAQSNGLSDDQKRLVSLLLAYMTAREESWTLLG